MIKKNQKINESHYELNLNTIEYVAKNKVTGFFDFIRTQGVMGLAIGFMLGDKIKNLVNSLTVDIINPFLMMLSGTTGELSNAKLRLFGVEVFWGRFASSLLDFLLMAIIVYIIFKVFSLDKLEKVKDKS